MDKRQMIIAQVHEAWVAAGKLHDPPDDTSADDDLGFWKEVESRLSAAEDGHLPDNGHLPDSPRLD